MGSTQLDGNQAPDSTPSPTRAEVALAFSARVATGQARYDDRPDKPTKDELRALSVSVLRTHLDALLVGREVERGLELVHQMGLFDVWLPEVASMVGFGDGEWRHKDVWKHTKQVCRQAIPRVLVRWGALLHDIGKPKTRSIEPDGTVHFFGHSEVGAAMFRKRVAKRLGFAGHEYDRVHFLILNHLRASQYDGSWTDSAVRRFYKEMGDGLDDLLALSRADITTKRPERRKRGLRQISEIAQRIRELKEDDAKVAPLPKGLGHLLMSELGIPASRKLGEVRRQLEEDVETGEIEAGKDSTYYVEWVKANRDRYDV